MQDRLGLKDKLESKEGALTLRLKCTMEFSEASTSSAYSTACFQYWHL